jgi:hypothetical protein
VDPLLLLRFVSDLERGHTIILGSRSPFWAKRERGAARSGAGVALSDAAVGRRLDRDAFKAAQCRGCGLARTSKPPIT